MNLKLVTVSGLVTMSTNGRDFGTKREFTKFNSNMINVSAENDVLTFILQKL